MIAILNEGDVCSERSLSQSTQISLYLPSRLPNLGFLQISNTNLYFFFCSNECQMPEHFWMVKFLGPINSLKLIGVLLSWDSFRPYAIYIMHFQSSRLYAIILWFNIFTCSVQEFFSGISLITTISGFL